MVHRTTIKISPRRWGVMFRLDFSNGGHTDYTLYTDKASRQFKTLAAAEREVRRMNHEYGNTSKKGSN